MKTIGLLGGMSWQSTIKYYQILNEMVAKEKGNLHSAKILMSSLDFQEVVDCQKSGRWDDAADILANHAKALEKSGADCVLIATNTMHKVAPQVQAAIKIPLLNIIDAVADSLKENKISKVGLLGTKFTMEDSFYRDHLKHKFQIDAIVPDKESDRIFVHSSIFDELCKGLVEEKSRLQYRRVIEDFENQKAQAVILGCTEICMIVCEKTSVLPIYDSTYLHCYQALKFSNVT